MGNHTTTTTPRVGSPKEMISSNKSNKAKRNSSQSHNITTSSNYQTATSSNSSAAVPSHKQNENMSPRATVVSNKSPNNSNDRTKSPHDHTRSDISRKQPPGMIVNPPPHHLMNEDDINNRRYVVQAPPNNAPVISMKPHLPLNAQLYSPNIMSLPAGGPPLIYQNYNMQPPPMFGQPVYYPPNCINRMVPPVVNNGMYLPNNVYGGNVPSAYVPKAPPATPKNQEINNEFASLIRNVRGESSLASSASASRVDSPKLTAVRKPSIDASPKIDEIKSPVNDVSNEFKSLMRNALGSKPKKDSSTPKETTKEKSTIETQPKIEKTLPKSSDVKVSTRTSTVINEVALEFSNIIKNVAHGETPPIVTCEYGLEIDGFKTYSIDEMLTIRSKMTYDVEKMIQRVNKFRISAHLKSTQKSEKLWKTIGEKRKLGLVNDKQMFSHALLQILNKVTAVNFYQNWSTFRNLKFTSAELVKLYAYLLYDKVIGEHSWSYVYSELTRVSINSLNQMYPNEGYADIFISTVMECINDGLKRDFTEEAAIKEMKKITSRDVETIERIIGETAERETSYRKKHFGVILYVANLYHDDVINEDSLDEILEMLKEEKSALGVELYVSMLEHIAIKYIEQNQVEMCRLIDTLNEYVKSHPKELTSKAKFAMMDLFKYKQDKFKNLPARKKVQNKNEAKPGSVSSTISSAAKSITVSSNSSYNQDSFRRSSTMDSYNSNKTKDKQYDNFNRNKTKSYKGDINDNRRPNVDAFQKSNRANSIANKGYTKNKCMGSVITSTMQRYSKMHGSIGLSLDEDTTTIPASASSITSRTNLETTKPLSLLKRETSVFTSKTNKLAANKPIPNKSIDKLLTNKPTIINKSIDNNTTIIKDNSIDNKVSTNKDTNNKEATTSAGSSLWKNTSKPYAPSVSTSLPGTNVGGKFKQPVKSMDSVQSLQHMQSSVDLDDDEIQDLVETAQTLIINYHQHETNVSRFMMELSGYSVSDHLDFLIRESFIYYSRVSHGHYAFGQLLSELMGRDSNLIPIIKKHLADQLVELPLNALDEPVLWDYFFLTVFPMLSNKRITLDHLHELLSITPDICNPQQIIVNMMTYCEKMLAKYDVPKMVAKQSETNVWKRLVTTQDKTVEKICAKLPLVSLAKAGHFVHWVDILLDVNYDASHLVQTFPRCYSSPDEGLKDLSKSLLLYSAIGDRFTNDLITIFNKRNKQFMDQLFGDNSSQRLLCYLLEAFTMFKFTPSGAIVDIGVPLYKNNHVDKEWLNSWRNQEDKQYDSPQINSDIYKIIKSRND